MVMHIFLIFYMQNSDKVGIGTQNPISTLNIIGGTTNTSGIVLNSYDVNTIITNVASSNYAKIQVTRNGSSGVIGANPWNLLLQPDGGDIGIGEANPINKLHLSFDTNNNGIIINQKTSNKQAYILFQENGSAKWQMGKQTDNTYLCMILSEPEMFFV